MYNIFTKLYSKEKVTYLFLPDVVLKTQQQRFLAHQFICSSMKFF